MLEFIEEMALLLDGLLANQDFRLLYSSDDGFRDFVNKALHLYNEGREEVRASYGRDGVMSYNAVLCPKAERLTSLIPHEVKV